MTDENEITAEDVETARKLGRSLVEEAGHGG
jgi:hypothetical protein